MSNENWCFRKHLYNFKVPLGHRENNFAKFDQNDVVVPTYAGETWWFFSYVVTGYILKKKDYATFKSGFVCDRNQFSL